MSTQNQSPNQENKNQIRNESETKIPEVLPIEAKWKKITGIDNEGKEFSFFYNTSDQEFTKFPPFPKEYFNLFLNIYVPNCDKDKIMKETKEVLDKYRQHRHSHNHHRRHYRRSRSRSYEEAHRNKSKSKSKSNPTEGFKKKNFKTTRSNKNNNNISAAFSNETENLQGMKNNIDGKKNNNVGNNAQVTGRLNENNLNNKKNNSPEKTFAEKLNLILQGNDNKNIGKDKPNVPNQVNPIVNQTVNQALNQVIGTNSENINKGIDNNNNLGFNLYNNNGQFLGNNNLSYFNNYLPYGFSTMPFNQNSQLSQLFSMNPIIQYANNQLLNAGNSNLVGMGQNVNINSNPLPDQNQNTNILQNSPSKSINNNLLNKNNSINKNTNSNNTNSDNKKSPNNNKINKSPNKNTSQSARNTIKNILNADQYLNAKNKKGSNNKDSNNSNKQGRNKSIKNGLNTLVVPDTEPNNGKKSISKVGDVDTANKKKNTLPEPGECIYINLIDEENENSSSSIPPVQPQNQNSNMCQNQTNNEKQLLDKEEEKKSNEIPQLDDPISISQSIIQLNEVNKEVVKFEDAKIDDLTYYDKFDAYSNVPNDVRINIVSFFYITYRSWKK